MAGPQEGLLLVEKLLAGVAGKEVQIPVPEKLISA
jgi:hypothetical protein